MINSIYSAADLISNSKYKMKSSQGHGIVGLGRIPATTYYSPTPQRGPHSRVKGGGEVKAVKVQTLRVRVREGWRVWMIREALSFLSSELLGY